MERTLTGGTWRITLYVRRKSRTEAPVVVRQPKPRRYFESGEFEAFDEKSDRMYALARKINGGGAGRTQALHAIGYGTQTEP